MYIIDDQLWASISNEIVRYILMDIKNVLLHSAPIGIWEMILSFGISEVVGDQHGTQCFLRIMFDALDGSLCFLSFALSDGLLCIAIGQQRSFGLVGNHLHRLLPLVACAPSAAVPEMSKQPKVSTTVAPPGTILDVHINDPNDSKQRLQKVKIYAVLL